MPTKNASTSAKKTTTQSAKPSKKVAAKPKAVTKPTTAATKKKTKVAAKKTTSTHTKKAAKATKSSKKKNLIFAPDQQSFWVMDGQILNSLVALAEAFDQMEKEVFEYHATGDQNDFAVWVSDVLCDGDCAVSITRAKTPRGAKTAVKRHLKTYSL